MNTLRKSTLIKRTIITLSCVIFFFLFNQIDVKAKEDNSISSITVLLNDKAAWVTGEYTDYGQPTTNKRRMRLAENITYDNEMLNISISEDCYCLIAYEFDTNGKFQESYELRDGDQLNRLGRKGQIAITIYRTFSEKCLSRDQWRRLFDNGLMVSIEFIKNISAYDFAEATVRFQNLDMSTISSYESGDFDDDTGYKKDQKRRIRIPEFIPICKDKLTISMNSDEMIMSLYEYDQGMNYIQFTEFVDGDVFTPTSETRYLGITIRRNNLEKKLSMGQWNNLFLNGLEISLMSKANTVQIAESVQNSEYVNNRVNSDIPKFNKSEYLTNPDEERILAATDKESLRKMLVQMLFSGDAESHDMSKLRLKYYEVESVWQDIIHDEGYYAYETHAGACLQTTYINNTSYIATVRISDNDNLQGEAFLARYNRMLDTIAEVQEATRFMSELEKALYVNDYLTYNVVYAKVNHSVYRAGGALGDGLAVCEGYARASRVLLKSIGMDAELVLSHPMNHAWTTVKIDGEWYHFDATWDDKFSSEYINEHKYFLRNDTEFKNQYKHYDWFYSREATETIVSTSTRFSNWFVHDVVGRIMYYNGEWYYIDPNTGDLVASQLDKTYYHVMIKKTDSNISIRDIKDGYLEYVESGITKKIRL